MIAIKRAYDPSSRSDGTRILVDRLWPIHEEIALEALEVEGEIEPGAKYDT